MVWKCIAIGIAKGFSRIYKVFPRGLNFDTITIDLCVVKALIPSKCQPVRSIQSKAASILYQSSPPGPFGVIAVVDSRLDSCICLFGTEWSKRSNIGARLWSILVLSHSPALIYKSVC